MFAALKRKGNKDEEEEGENREMGLQRVGGPTPRHV